MGIKQRCSSQPVEIKVAIISGLVALLGGIIAGVFALVAAEVETATPSLTATATASAANTESPVISPPSPTASVCPNQLSLIGPPDGSSFASGDKKTLSITGTACGLAGDTGWLFDYDPADQYYYDDYPGATPSAAVSTSQTGAWTYSDGAPGGSGDQHERYVITLVLANPN